MTRRGILKFLGLAPVALPAAALVAPDVFVGVDAAALGGAATFVISPSKVRYLDARHFVSNAVSRGVLTVDEVRTGLGCPPCI